MKSDFSSLKYGSKGIIEWKENSSKYNSSFGFFYNYYKNSNTLFFVVNISGKDSVVSIPLSSESSKWINVVGVYNEKNVSLYIDGKLVNQTNSKAGKIKEGGILSFGNLSGFFFKGYIDEVRIYSDNFNDKKVSDLYIQSELPYCEVDDDCDEGYECSYYADQCLLAFPEFFTYIDDVSGLDYDRFISQGNQTNISVVFYNSNTRSLNFSDVNVSVELQIVNYPISSLFEPLFDSNILPPENISFNTIASTKFSKIYPKEYFFFNFSMTPIKSGLYTFIVNISNSSGSSMTSENHLDFISFLVYNNSIEDIGIDYTIPFNQRSTFFEYENLIPTNYYVGSEININNFLINYGNQTSKNVSLFFYDNNNLVYNKSFSVEFHNTNISEFLWTPTTSGNHKLRAEVSYSNDKNKKNDVLEKNYFIYPTYNVTFSATNFSGSPVNRILLVPSKDKFIPMTFKGEINISLVNYSEFNKDLEFGVIIPYNRSFFVFIYKTNFSQNISFQSQPFSIITQDDEDYRGVFLMNFSVPSKLIYMYYFVNKTTLFDSPEFSYYDASNLVSCSSFDRISQRCLSSWENADDFYSSSTKDMKYDLKYYIDSQFYYIIPLINVSDYFFYSSLEEPLDIDAIAFTSSYFDGNTTNFSKISNFDNVSSLHLEKTRFGKIIFSKSVNLTSVKSSKNIKKELRKSVLFSPKTIRVNATFLNTSAQLMFYNLNYYYNPQVYKDGQLCSNTDCSPVDYDSFYDILSVNVTGFSTYDVREGPYCGNDECVAPENCSTCWWDCGNCVTPNPNPNPNSNLDLTPTPITISCIESWKCNWTSCMDLKQTYLCSDSNFCNTTRSRPSSNGTIKACLNQPQVSICIDQDLDGYGQGASCKGIDLDDTNSSITDKIPKSKINKPESSQNWIFILVIVLLNVLIFVIVGVIWRVIKSRQNSAMNLTSLQERSFS